MKKLLIRNIIFLLSLQACNVYAELSTFADLLLWHASEETASTWANVASVPKSTAFDLDAANIDFGWNIGFRGGVLYEAQPNFWDSRLYWTFFRTKTNSNIAIAEQIIYPEFFSGFFSTNKFFGADINWKLEMNMVDYDISHQFNVGNSLTIRPAIGIKGGTINQTISSTWNAVVYKANEDLKHDFFGIGPSFSIDTRFNMYKNFAIFGDFSTAFMWGNWKISDVYTRPASLFSTQTTISTYLKQTLLGTMMFKYCLGLEWIYHGRSNLTLQIGYEMQFWVNQLRLPIFQQLPLHGDLTLQGGTCRIRIDL